MAPAEPKPATMVDSRVAAHKLHKLWLTVLWLCGMIASFVFVILAFVTLNRLRRVYYDEPDLVGNVGYVYNRSYIWGAIYASSVVPILLLLFIIISTYFVAKKVIPGNAGLYTTGVLHSATLLFAFMLLQSALSLHAFKKAAQDDWEQRPGGKWSRGTTSLYQATYVFAYLLFIGYLALLLALLLFQRLTTRLKRVPPPPGAPAAVSPAPVKGAVHVAERPEHAVVHVSTPVVPPGTVKHVGVPAPPQPRSNSPRLAMLPSTTAEAGQGINRPIAEGANRGYALE